MYYGSDYKNDTSKFKMLNNRFFCTVYNGGQRYEGARTKWVLIKKKHESKRI